jgi:hypothetical protein
MRCSRRPEKTEVLLLQKSIWYQLAVSFGSIMLEEVSSLYLTHAVQAGHISLCNDVFLKDASQAEEIIAELTGVNDLKIQSTELNHGLL